MTSIILLSQISALPFDFAEAVESHRQALLAHRFTVGEPAPTAHPLVEEAVRRVPGVGDEPDDFVTAFEVVDDTPPAPPAPTLSERKAAIVMKLRQAEQAAADLVRSPGKHRLAQLDHSRIAMTPTAERSADDIARLDQISRENAALMHIQLKGATLEAEIDDATVETIDDVEAAYSGDLSERF